MAVSGLCGGGASGEKDRNSDNGRQSKVAMGVILFFQVSIYSCAEKEFVRVVYVIEWWLGNSCEWLGMCMGLVVINSSRSGRYMEEQ